MGFTKPPARERLTLALGQPIGRLGNHAGPPLVLLKSTEAGSLCLNTIMSQELHTTLIPAGRGRYRASLNGKLIVT
jgi:hypothetical protein